MMEKAITGYLNKKVRRLMGQELAMIREAVRRGKQLNVKMGKMVAFEPVILNADYASGF